MLQVLSSTSDGTRHAATRDASWPPAASRHAAATSDDTTPRTTDNSRSAWLYFNAGANASAGRDPKMPPIPKYAPDHPGCSSASCKDASWCFDSSKLFESDDDVLN